MSADPIPAAQYLRMSSELQQYSLQNQADAIAQYALRNGFRIVRTFADAARSGVSCKHRKELQDLLRETISGQADFRAILVYDVSRWGRFQDVDEAAHYEYICKDAGIPIFYCAEPFPRELGLATSILKAVKRSMAGEYSRELSIKVHNAKMRLAKMGYQLGSYPPYGMRRLMISADGTPKQILEFRQWKSLQTDRVVLVPGPREEVAVVQRIFREFVEEHRKPIEIARRLRAEGLRNLQGSLWTNGSVIRTLRQSKYTGSQVWGKSRKFLQTRRQSQRPEQWVVCPGAFQPIIPQATFDAAQAEFARFTKNMSDEALIKKLERVIEEEGRIDKRKIRDSHMCPGTLYKRRFGSLLAVYERLFLLGHTNFLAYRQRALIIKRRLARSLAEACPGQLQEVHGDRRWSVLLRVIASGKELMIHIAKCIPTSDGQMRWTVNLHPKDRGRLTVIALLDKENSGVNRLLLSPDMSHLDRVGPCIKFKMDTDWLRMCLVVNQNSDFSDCLLQVDTARAS